MIYIHKINGFWNLKQELPDSYKTGTTLEEYENGAYLLLDAEQTQFHIDNPKASQLECYNKVLNQKDDLDNSATKDLNNARYNKLDEIYNKDAESNKFYVSVIKGGAEITKQELWIDKDLRNSLYSITLPSLKEQGETVTKLWTTTVPPQSIDVPIDWAMEKLPLLEVYAKKTYDLKTSNEAKVYAATTIDEVNAIDVTIGYPDILVFGLNIE